MLTKTMISMVLKCSLWKTCLKGRSTHFHQYGDSLEYMYRGEPDKLLQNLNTKRRTNLRGEENEIINYIMRGGTALFNRHGKH